MKKILLAVAILLLVVSLSACEFDLNLSQATDVFTSVKTIHQNGFENDANLADFEQWNQDEIIIPNRDHLDSIIFEFNRPADSSVYQVSGVAFSFALDQTNEHFQIIIKIVRNDEVVQKANSMTIDGSMLDYHQTIFNDYLDFSFDFVEFSSSDQTQLIIQVVNLELNDQEFIVTAPTVSWGITNLIVVTM